MKTIRICSVAVFALTLAACPADDRDAGVAARDTLARDAPGAGAMARDTGMMARDTAAMSERVELGELNNSGVTGEATLTARNNQVEVRLAIRGARPNARVAAHIHRGSCDSQGPVAAPLDAINTDNAGNGTSTTTVSLEPMSVMNGQHYVQAHTAGADPGPPTACGDIPEHTM